MSISQLGRRFGYTTPKTEGGAARESKHSMKSWQRSIKRDRQAGTRVCSLRISPQDMVNNSRTPSSPNKVPPSSLRKSIRSASNYALLKNHLVAHNHNKLVSKQLAAMKCLSSMRSFSSLASTGCRGFCTSCREANTTRCLHHCQSCQLDLFSLFFFFFCLNLNAPPTSSPVSFLADMRVESVIARLCSRQHQPCSEGFGDHVMLRRTRSLARNANERGTIRFVD